MKDDQQQTEEVNKVGRKTKYDFSCLEQEGEFMMIHPARKSGVFTKAQAHSIGVSLSQYKRTYKPNSIFTLKSIHNEFGRIGEIRIYLLIKA
jgi:hypothetical protein